VVRPSPARSATASWSMSDERELDALTLLRYALGDLEAARSQPGRHIRPRIVAFNTTWPPTTHPTLEMVDTNATPALL